MIQDLRGDDVNGAVCKVPGGIGDLLMKTPHPSVRFELENPAILRPVGPEGQEGHQDIGIRRMVSSDKVADVGICQVVGMRNEEGRPSQPFAARQDGASGAQQSLQGLCATCALTRSAR